MDLIEACESNDTEKALGLIMNNSTNLDIVDANGKTVFSWACENKMTEVALELIKAGHVDDYGNTLILACYHGMTEVALELIKMNMPNFGQVDNYGYTALTWACCRKMKEVALELIKTGHAKPEHVDNDDNTALFFSFFY